MSRCRQRWLTNIRSIGHCKRRIKGSCSDVPGICIPPTFEPVLPGGAGPRRSGYPVLSICGRVRPKALSLLRSTAPTVELLLADRDRILSAEDIVVKLLEKVSVCPEPCAPLARV